jgi:alanyl-tRNA synthetase
MNTISHVSLRKLFTAYFEEKKHVEIPPIPLVPENDPTTLFTGSGMQQLIPYLMGQPHPLGKRLFNIQRSFRTQDIEEVGDNRHTTFFEMMGNWSLGDYFKQEQLAYFFEFLTKVLQLPNDRLFVTVFEGNKDVPKDTESEKQWKELGIQNNHIAYYGVEKNWWSRSGTPDTMPEGEIGGPDSEVFYDLGNSHDPKYGKSCHPNCDCGRFIEIGNSVFIQYKKESGKLVELPNKNVDFGGGLERILTALQSKRNVFETDVFYPIIQTIQKITGKEYGTYYEDDRSFRILADHIRASVFLIADGVLPSNKEQGYVLRRLIRRAVRFGSKITLPENQLSVIAESVLSVFGKIYPNLTTYKNLIQDTILVEETKFRTTMDRGIKEFDKILALKKTLSPKDVFFLYESYGFPLELTMELAKEHSIIITEKDIAKEKSRHKEISKKGMEKKFKGGLADHSEETIKLHTATHLLHHALRNVLGSSVKQKGSNITSERLRFDFSFPRALTEIELTTISTIVNDAIRNKYDVWQEILPKKQAELLGALAFFGEKYGDTVSVYFIGNKQSKFILSKEFCGGPHVYNTDTLGTFEIQKETSAGSGIRRVYAILK